MRHVKTIESPGSARFLLDLHTDYLQRIIEVVRGIAPAKIFLEADDINRWDAGIKEQSEITREVRASKTTEDLGKKDEERDRIITSLFQDIRSATLSPIAARSEPGRTLKLIVDEQVAPQVGDHAHLLIAIDQSGADTHVNAGRSSHIPGCQHIVPYFMCEQRQNKFLRTGGSGSSSTHERCCAPQVHMNAHGAQIDPGQGVLRRFLQERGPVEAAGSRGGSALTPAPSTHTPNHPPSRRHTTQAR